MPDFLLSPIVIIASAGYFVLQAVFLKRYSGGWRIAIWIPLFFMIPAVVQGLLLLVAGSSQWPVFILLQAPYLFVYLAIVGATHFLVRTAFAKRWPPPSSNRRTRVTSPLRGGRNRP